MVALFDFGYIKWYNLYIKNSLYNRRYVQKLDQFDDDIYHSNSTNYFSGGCVVVCIVSLIILIIFGAGIYFLGGLLVQFIKGFF